MEPTADNSEKLPGNHFSRIFRFSSTRLFSRDLCHIPFVLPGVFFRSAGGWVSLLGMLD
jgi:hypothetical protein